MSTFLICLGLMAVLVWVLIHTPLVRKLYRASCADQEASSREARTPDGAKSIGAPAREPNSEHHQRISDDDPGRCMQIDTNNLRWDDLKAALRGQDGLQRQSWDCDFGASVMGRAIGASGCRNECSVCCLRLGRDSPEDLSALGREFCWTGPRNRERANWGGRPFHSWVCSPS